MKVGDWVKCHSLVYEDKLYHLGIIKSFESSNYAIVDFKVAVLLGNYQSPRSYMQGLTNVDLLKPYKPTIKEIFLIRKYDESR